MDLKRLRTFLQVADLGSVTLASERLHIAQPALSRQIRLLEEELGITLFDRDGRGMSLTPAGTRLYSRIVPLFRELEEAKAEVSGIADEVGGRIVVGIPPTCNEIFGSVLVRRFLADYPSVALCIVTGLSGHLFDWLQRGEVDAALMYGPPPSESILTEPLATERLALVGSPSREPAPTGTIDFATVAGLPLVLPAQKHGLRRMLEAAAYAQGLPLNVRVETDSLRIQLDLVMHEPLFTIISRKAVRRELAVNTVAAWDILEPIVTRDLVFAMPADRAISGALRTFRQVVRELANRD
jgi:LysR family nitrogen assimilation transcriptional regulator